MSHNSVGGGLQAAASDLAASVERAYREFEAQTPGMDHDYARMVRFSLLAKDLAESGVGLGVLVKQVFRVYGLETHNIEVTDAEDGEVLLNDAAAGS